LKRKNKKVDLFRNIKYYFTIIIVLLFIFILFKDTEKIKRSPVTIDCENKNYKMAFILVENSTYPSNQSDINKMDILKQRTSETFNLVTNYSASLDTSYPVKVLNMQGNPTVQQITNLFYQTNPDIFDFITIFITYPDSNTQYHLLARNHVKGIGLSIFDASNVYGSNNKLLGINWMKDIDNYYVDPFNLILGVNGILHETSHQWGAFVDYINETGQVSRDLRNPYNIVHWDKKLETRYGLLGGYSWIDNNNGTFTARLYNVSPNGYSNLDLYLLGLIPKEDVGLITLIHSDVNSSVIYPGITIPGVAEIISVQQVINVEGERKFCCVDENCTSPSLQYDLEPGFNFITVPFELTNNDINQVFNTIINDVNRIYYFNNSWKVFRNNLSTPSSLNSIESLSGYIVVMNNQRSLTIRGPINNSSQINSNSGWNLIGINSLSSISIQAALQNLNYTSVWEYNNLLNNYVQLNPLTDNFEPGKAYWIYLNNSGIFNP